MASLCSMCGLVSVQTPFGMSDLAKTFGDNLRLARLELRMSQRELAKFANISQRHVSLVENGGNVTLSVVEALSNPVGRTPAELMTKRAR